MPNIGTTIKRRRAELGMSQAELAKASGINLRQIRRYESDEQQPAIGVALRLASALGITIGELAGETSTLPQLAGNWWAAWQTFIGGTEITTTQPVAIEQTGATLRIRATGLAEQANAGDYLWRGELRIWGDDTLIGWYAATDENVRSKGTMFFVLHTQGQYALGRWVGTSYDGPIVTGGAALARDHDQLGRIVERRAHIEPKETA